MAPENSHQTAGDVRTPLPVIRFILGTRPEAIKTLPILRELKARKVAFEVIHTGQHTDLMEGTGLKPDVCLGVPGTNDPLAYVDAAYEALWKVFHVSPHPQRIVVQGDTASALAGARYAREFDIPLCHVEAGLRSNDLRDPWPEESFRLEIDHLSTFLFCPTQGNWDNYDAEVPSDMTFGAEAGSHGAFVTGNTIVDALKHSGVTRQPGNHVLVTLHRRESFGEPLQAILHGLSTVARQHPDTPFLWPVHPNPHVKEALDAVELPTNVLTRPPLPYQGFLQFLASAKAVLTDSGGVVEEACTLGVPTVIARDKTERPEALVAPDGGTYLLAGKSAEGVANRLELAINDTACAPSNVFGDGHAAQRIADLLT